jgi:hypothetical protein
MHNQRQPEGEDGTVNRADRGERVRSRSAPRPTAVMHPTLGQRCKNLALRVCVLTSDRDQP